MSTLDRVKVTKAQDLLSFDYSKFVFPTKGDYLDVLRVHYDKFINPIVPIVAVLLYLIASKPICTLVRNMCGQTDPIRAKDGGKKDGETWTYCIKKFSCFHSTLLAAYSGWTFYNTFSLVMKVVASHQARNPNMGWVDAFYLTNCDHDSLLWTDNDFGTWVYHFYMSKYWEFPDTWISLLRGREPIFLQTFHHAGIVLLMWSFCASHNNTMGICVTVLNSFIHTIMYSYYAMSAANVRFPDWIKPLITIAQLTQFVTGILYSTPTYWMPRCHTDATWWTQFAVNMYTLVLIALFADFGNKTYFSKSKETTSKKLN